MKKRLILLLMGICLILSLNISVMAAGIDGVLQENNSLIEPRWTNIATVSLDIQFSGTTITCSGGVTGMSGTTKIVAAYRLYKINANGSTTLLKTFPTVTSSMSMLNFSGTGTGSSGNTYRLEVTVDCTRKGTTETVVDYYDRKY